LSDMESKEDVLSRNKEIADKFAVISKRLPHLVSVESLFDSVIAGFEVEFGIPYVWITLLDDVPGSSLFKRLSASIYLSSRLCLVERSVFKELTGEGNVPILVNQGLRPYFRLMPPSRKYLLRSLAVAPITINGLVVGSINLGDASSSRYEQGMDTTLLSEMMHNVSMRLTELLNDGTA